MDQPPLVNATLTQIAGGGSSEEYDRPDTADTARWSGAVGAYVGEVLESDTAGGKLDQVAQTRAVVPLAVGELAQRNDTVVYTFAGASHTRKVRNVQQFRLFGTVALFLWSE